MADLPHEHPTPDLSRVVIATGNPHKVEELSRLLALPGVEFVGLRDLPGHETFTEPEETGDTFEANAAIKARSYTDQTGLPCLADDSGLEVDALGGAPGVISSHYCTDGREVGMTRAQRDAANNAKLLQALEGVPAQARTARFVCVMVLASAAPTGAGHSGSRTPIPLHERWQTGRPIDRRHTDLLPHWEKGGSTYFLTFRLQQGTLNPAERRIVLDACLYWHPKRVALHLAVVMPDHVHLLVTPQRIATEQWASIPWFMQSVKSFSAKRLNEIRSTAGRVWQDEYFDRIVRDKEEFTELSQYVAANPVRAGLTSCWWAYPFAGGDLADRAREGAIGFAEQGLRDPECPAPSMVPVQCRLLATSRGTFDGRIGTPGPPPAGVPRGTNGFGYDPLFLAGPECRHTGAELSAEEKNRRSHRGVAAGDMLLQLCTLVRGG